MHQWWRNWPAHWIWLLIRLPRVVRTTVNETVKPINAANLRDAHAKVEAGRSIGKVVLAGW